MHTKTRILAAYESLAIHYNAHIDTKAHNALYDRPNTLALLGEVKGKAVLDAACGPGKYAEILLGEGADVTGFDLSPEMVRLATERNAGKGRFFVHDLAEPLPFADASFDVVVCALALDYLETWGPTFREFYRVLRPGGRLVCSMQHPFFEYTYHNAQNYFTTEAVSSIWKGFGKRVEVPCYRRPLSAIIGPLLESGLMLAQLVEPLPLPEMQAVEPEKYASLCRFPGFMMLRAVKG